MPGDQHVGEHTLTVESGRGYIEPGKGPGLQGGRNSLVTYRGNPMTNTAGGETGGKVQKGKGPVLALRKGSVNTKGPIRT